MPFTVSIDDTAPHPVITLTDATSGTYAEVYAFGALLNTFSAMHAGEHLNVIDGFPSVEGAMTLITPAFRSAKLSPFVCRIGNAQYTFGGEQYTLSKYSLNGSALHGLLYDQVFKIASTNNGDESASVELVCLYDNKDEGFPFTYQCTVRYTLGAKNRLTVATTLVNMNDTLIPVADGWHPYFTLGDAVDECQLEFQSKEMVEFTPELLPTGSLLPYQEYGSLKAIGAATFDNCFTLNFAECQPLVVFRNPAKKVQVEIYPDQSYPYLQIFIPPHRNSIALENLSALPDALNNFTGLHVLEPNQSIQFSTQFAITSI